MSNPMRAILVLLIATILIVPIASAGTSANLLMKMDSPSKMIIEAKGTFTGEDASDWREQLDINRDGSVSADEVSQAEAFFMSSMQRERGNESEKANASIGGGFTVDGKGANDFRFADLDIQGAEGDVTSDKAWSVLMTMEIMFDVQAGERHTIRIDGGKGEEDDSGASEFLGEIESAKFRAASGYIFSDIKGLPSGAKVSGDKKEIEFGDAVSAPSGEAVITMSKGGSGGSAPGLGFGVVLAALAAIALVSRRR